MKQAFEQNALTVAVVSLLSTDEGYSKLASAKAARLESLFAENNAEAVASALSTKSAAQSLIALSPAASKTWLAEQTIVGETDDERNECAQGFAAQASKMRSAYIMLSQAKGIYRARCEHAKVYADFLNSDKGWNDRLDAMRKAVEAIEQGSQRNADAALLAQASEIRQKELAAAGVEVPTVTTDDALAMVDALAAAAKVNKETAAKSPETLADKAIKEWAKKGANGKAILALLVKAYYGEGYEILPVAEVDALRAEVREQRRKAA